MNRLISRTVTGAAALGLAAGIIPVLATSATAAVVAAPGGLKVARSGGALTDLAITWRPVTGADHYTVTVFDGSRDVVRVVPGSQTSFSYAGSGTCTRYRVKVSAVMPDGAVATSNDFLVGSLAPGGINGVKATRDEAGSTGVVAWGVPSIGNGAVESYRVTVTELASRKVLVARQSPDAVEKIGGLDPKRVYVAKVTPTNRYGSCSTGTVLLGNRLPTAPGALSVTRDPGVPAQADLSWSAPSWSGYGPVTHYLVGYGNSRVTTWVKAGSPRLSLNLDPSKDWVFQVRAASSDDLGSLGRPARLLRVGAPGTPALDPKVTVTEKDGNVSVDFSGPVGSSAAFPKMNVSIAPTMDKGTFRDSHMVSNGAGSVDFDKVPCGVYTVTVTGIGAGVTKEFGRAYVNRCETGLLPASLWKLVFGQAKISGNLVDMPNGSETRVVSVARRSTQDMVMTTTATLRSGWGYGIWVRANVNGGAAVSGYSVQYDPGYAKVSSFGKALLLRQWQNGSECGTPIAKVPFPAGVAENAPHQFTVVAKGDSLYVQIDGKTVFDVPSLTKAVAASPCKYAMPTGTDIGFRTWGAGTSAVFDGTTLS